MLRNYHNLFVQRRGLGPRNDDHIEQKTYLQSAQFTGLSVVSRSEAGRPNPLCVKWS